MTRSTGLPVEVTGEQHGIKTDVRRIPGIVEVEGRPAKPLVVLGVEIGSEIDKVHC